MSLKLGIIMSIVLFALGVLVQGIEINSATYNYQTTWLSWIYVPLYVCGIGFMPISAFISKLIDKIRK